MLSTIAAYIGYFLTVCGFLAFLWRFWKKMQDVANGQKCLLRSEIMAIYYRHCDEEEPFSKAIAVCPLVRRRMSPRLR